MGYYYAQYMGYVAAEGKKEYDKRQSIKEKDMRRDMERE